MKDAIARMPPGLPNTATRRASGTIHPAYRWRRSQRTGVVACGAFHFWWRDGAGFGPRCVWVFRSGSMIIRGLRRSERRSPANHVGCCNADVRADRRPGGGGTFVFGVGMQLSGGAGGAISTCVLNFSYIIDCVCFRRIIYGVWRAPSLWMQYRRGLFRRGVDKFTWLALDNVRLGGDTGRSKIASAVWSLLRRDEAVALELGMFTP
jgi:hypothetical protein